MKTDLLIIGAGCSGLSLAVHLTLAGLEGRRVLVLDPRTTFDRDRTWCFWDTERHPFEAAISHRWSRWAVQHGGKRHESSSSRYAYCQLPADAFYRLALDRLAEAPEVTVRTGVTVHDLTEGPGGVTAQTSIGPIWAKMAFDSRPVMLHGAPARGEVRLLQHFAGRIIETSEPAFDPGAVTLMDFDVEEPGAHFAYVLPYDERRALVEDTWMTDTPHSPEVYERCMDSYIRGSLSVRDFRVVETERGVIPMTTEDITPHHSVRVFPIGLRGGRARPSTGYAFLAIQRHARELARRVVSAELPEPPPPRPAHQQFMDRVFLNVLEQQSQNAGALFLRMFAKAEPDTLVRFLSEVGTPRDLLAIMTALRSVSFTREAARQLARAV